MGTFGELDLLDGRERTRPPTVGECADEGFGTSRRAGAPFANNGSVAHMSRETLSKIIRRWSDEGLPPSIFWKDYYDRLERPQETRKVTRKNSSALISHSPCAAVFFMTVTGEDAAPPLNVIAQLV